MRRRVAKTQEFREGWAESFAVCRKARTPQEALSRLAAETDMRMAITLLDSTVRSVLVDLHAEAKRRVKGLAKKPDPAFAHLCRLR